MSFTPLFCFSHSRLRESNNIKNLRTKTPLGILLLTLLANLYSSDINSSAMFTDTEFSLTSKINISNRNRTYYKTESNSNYWSQNRNSDSESSYPSMDSMTNLSGYGYKSKLPTEINFNNAFNNENADGSCNSNNLYSALAGEYQIGGVSPDFNTIKDAVDTLNIYGITDTVWFRIRSGIYNEQFEITQFSGSNCSSPVIFESETGDSTDVTISFDASDTSNYILNIDGADGIVFRNLTLKAINDSYGTIVNLLNGTDCIQFVSCYFLGFPTNSTSSAHTLISSSNSKNDHNEYRYCRFENGSTGLFLRSNSYYLKDNNTVVDHCDFINNRKNAVYLFYHDSVQISNNKVITNSNSSTYIGMYLAKVNVGFALYNNHLDLKKGTGFYFNSNNGNIGDEGLISNNFISIGDTGKALGIYFSQGSNMKFYHNNIHIYSSDPTLGKAIHLENHSYNISFLNNLIVNSGGGYAFYYDDPYGEVHSDYNNLFTTGPYIGFWGDDVGNLNAFQTVSGQEYNSVNVDPEFTSNTDLHVKKASLNGAGISVPEVIVDYDNELRSMPPDIGADEFEPIGFNVTVDELVSPQLPFISGNNEIRIALKNLGDTILTSADILWSLDNVSQSEINWTGNLNKNESDTILLGSYSFLPLESHNLKAWVQNPSFTNDIDPSDDTLTVTNIQPGLQGFYSVGGLNPDFTNLSESVDLLNHVGVADTVVFNIRSGTYNEQLRIIEFPRADSLSPVIFRSETGDSSDVLITNYTNSVNNYTVFLDGADRVTLQNLSLQATNNSLGIVFQLENGANGNKILNNRLIGVDPTGNVGECVVINSSSFNVKDNNNIFANNLIENGSYSFFFNGPNVEINEFGTELLNNICINYKLVGIWLAYQDSPKVKGNYISTNSTESIPYGMYLFRTNFDISHNKINLPNGGAGIYINSYLGSVSGDGLITNNFISVGGLETGIGIEVSMGNFIKFLNNSVHITNNHLTKGRALSIGNAGNLTFLNNIFANKGGGYAIDINILNEFTSAHNDLYTSGPILVKSKFYGSIATLSEYQENSGSEANSVSVDPEFLSDSDLHTNNFSLDRIGISVPEVTDDIDGQARNLSHPDIGADEFNPPPDDAGIAGYINPSVPFNSGVQEMVVALTNYGDHDLTSVDIEWTVNGVSQPTYNWVGNLLTRDTISVNIGSYDFDMNSSYSILSNTSFPNGMIDESTVNDTFKLEEVKVALNGEYYIGGESPDFPTINSAVSALNNRGVSGQVIFNLRGGVYDEQIELVEVLGASSENNIVFQSESLDSTMAIITYSSFQSSKNYTLYINGADYITFQYITFTASGDPYGRVIYIDNESTFVKVSNNYIKGRSVAANSANFLTNVIASDSGNDHHLSIVNNRIENGHEALRLFGESNNSPESGVLISGNIIINPNYEGINLQYLSEPKVIGNSISNTLPQSTRTGILLNDIDGSFQVEQNYIALTGGNGIAIKNCNATLGMEGKINNNFISIGDEYVSNGIYCSNSTFQNFYFNSVNNFSPVNNSFGAMNLYNSSDITLVNNIFASTGGAYAMNVRGLNNIRFSNYNNIYSSESRIAISNATVSYSLVDWRELSDHDTNSLSVNVCFSSLTDLHNGNAELESAGIPIPGILYDFDGEIRNSLTPDIGADEYTCISDLTIENKTLVGDLTFRSSSQIDLKNVVLDGNITLMTPMVIFSNSITFKEGSMVHYVEKNGCN